MAKFFCTRRPRIALELTVLLSLFASAVTIPAIASPDELRWSPVSIPTEGQAGNWVLAAGSDVQHLALAINGTLYAYGKGLTYTLYKSTNGGYSWSYIGNVRDNIVGIATSPHDANVLYYTTKSGVYRSSDGGRSFVQLPANPGGAGSGNIEVTAIAVTWLRNHVIAVGTRDTDVGQFGGVYTLDEEQLIAGWADTSLGSYDVYGVAFSPNYPGDRQLVAVVTNETDTYVTAWAGYVGWGTTTGNARLNRDNAAPPSPVSVNSSAAIAFPGDYDANPTSGNNALFVAIDTGAGNGDVYRVNGPSATDLNLGSAYGLRNSDVTGLAISGSAASARLMVGAASSAETYFSSDGGKNWVKSSKKPTGTARTYVLMPSGPGARAYAATSGTDSALSVSQDSGATWNQASLIDTTVSTIVDLSPSPVYSRDGTMFLLTFGGKHSLWRTTGDATPWERVFSSALSGVDSLSMIELSPQYGSGSQVVFLTGSSAGRPVVWQSVDNGQRFNCRPALDPSSGAPLSIDAWVVTNDTSLFLASYNGSISLVYQTTNGGFFYSIGAPSGNQPLNALVPSPSYGRDGTILAGDANGGVYWSSDNGTSLQSLPPSATSPPLAGVITVAFDSRFDSNRTVYAASSTANKGVYRFIVGRSTEWESIDSTLPAGGMLNQLLLSADGVLYAVNTKAGGGMERSLDPTYSLGPTFDTVSRGLGTNATLFGLWQANHKLWSVDTTNIKLMTYTDTLTAPATPTSPPDAASGTGSLIDHTVKNIRLDWGPLPEATSYQWQLNYNRDFSTIPSGFEGTTDSSSARLPTLEPGTTYYWRVRASAPVLSPWSTRRSFTTSLDTEVAPLRLESPRAGVSDVPVKPLFQWAAVAGADAYELLVSTDSSFARTLVAKTDGNALPTTSWQCDLSLKNDTTYYWKVRAVNASTASAWSAVSTFATDSAAPPRPPVIAAPPPPAAMPPSVTPTVPSLTPTVLSPTLSPQSVPLAPALPPPTPAQTSPQPAPVAPPPAPLLTVLNWAAYLIGALLLTIVLLLVIILVLVLKIRGGNGYRG